MITKKTAQLLAAIGTIAMLAVCLFGCGKSPETVTVKLPGNATTGYTWRYSMDRTDVVRETGSDYIVSDSHGMVGVGGVQTYTFEAIGDGTVTIDFYYGRPWEAADDSHADAEYVYSVSGGHIVEVGRTGNGE